MRITYDRRIKVQAECFDDDDSRYLMMCGGYGAGKTGLAVYKTLKLSWLNRGNAGGIMAPSLPEFKRDFLPMMLDIMQREIPGAQYWAQGKFGMHFRFPWSSQPVYVFTAERPVKGPNLGWGVINEFSLIPLVRINEFIARRRLPNVPHPQIVFSGTPEDEYGWLDDFMAKHEKTGRLKVRYATTFDNTFNDPDYGSELLENLDEATAGVYVYGRPGRLGKNYFYGSFSPATNEFPIMYDEDLTIHVAMDFNVGRMCASFWHIYGDGIRKQAGAFGELMTAGQDGTTEGLGKAIRSRFGTENVIVTCDASGKARKTSGLSDVDTLEDLGFKVRYRTANPPIVRSQRQVNGLLAKRRILINPETCRLLKNDLMKVEQKADFEQDKRNEKLTHFGDGMRYLIAQEFPDVLDREFRQRYKVARLGVR